MGSKLGAPIPENPYTQNMIENLDPESDRFHPHFIYVFEEVMKNVGPFWIARNELTGERMLYTKINHSGIRNKDKPIYIVSDYLKRDPKDTYFLNVKIKKK